MGFNAGLDFETKIVVKRNAAKLFRDFLARPSWKPESVAFSGVTDCYQPAERDFRLTRQCLEIAAECRQPVGIVTKNALICRDLDVLTQMAADQLVHTFVSIKTLDAELAREMEPRTSTPLARLRAIKTLADAGVPVGVMTAPRWVKKLRRWFDAINSAIYSHLSAPISVDSSVRLTVLPAQLLSLRSGIRQAALFSLVVPTV